MPSFCSGVFLCLWFKLEAKIKAKEVLFLLYITFKVKKKWAC